MPAKRISELLNVSPIQIRHNTSRTILCVSRYSNPIDIRANADDVQTFAISVARSSGSKSPNSI